MNKSFTFIILSFLLLLSACGNEAEKYKAGNEAEKYKAESGPDNSDKEEQVTDSFSVGSIEDLVEYYQRNEMTAK